MSIDILGNIDVQRPNLTKPGDARKKPPGEPGHPREEVVARAPVDGKAIINQAIEKLRSLGDLFNRRLDFRVDEATNRVVVKIIDTETDKVIKEIPPEQILHLAAKIQEMIGLLVDEEC